MHFFKRSKNGYGYFWRSLINSIFTVQAFLPPDTSHVRLHLPAFARHPLLRGACASYRGNLAQR